MDHLRPEWSSGGLSSCHYTSDVFQVDVATDTDERALREADAYIPPDVGLLQNVNVVAFQHGGDYLVCNRAMVAMTELAAAERLPLNVATSLAISGQW